MVKIYQGEVTQIFEDDNLWHVKYEDGYENNLDASEVVEAVKLFYRTTRPRHVSRDSSTIAAQSPSNTPTQTRTPRVQPSQQMPALKQRIRAERLQTEENVEQMRMEFQDMCVEDQKDDNSVARDMDAHFNERIFDDAPDDIPNELHQGQCSWCGFSDHTRKTSTHCPQHSMYSGSRYKKGDKIRESWIPGNHKSHERRHTPMTPTNVRSAPQCEEWKTENWIEGTSASNDWTAEEFDISTYFTLTRPKPSHDWTIETKAVTLFDNFYTVNVYVMCVYVMCVTAFHTQCITLCYHNSLRM